MVVEAEVEDRGGAGLEEAVEIEVDGAVGPEDGGASGTLKSRRYQLDASRYKLP